MTKHQVDDPNQLQITITERLRSTPTHHRYYADVIALNDEKTSGKLLIRMRKEDSLELDLDFTLKTDGKKHADNSIFPFTIPKKRARIYFPRKRGT